MLQHKTETHLCWDADDANYFHRLTEPFDRMHSFFCSFSLFHSILARLHFGFVVSFRIYFFVCWIRCRCSCTMMKASNERKRKWNCSKQQVSFFTHTWNNYYYYYYNDMVYSFYTYSTYMHHTNRCVCVSALIAEWIYVFNSSEPSRA